MNTSSSILTKPIIVCLLASVCCALWGSAYPCVKLGYGLFGIDTQHTPSILLFAGMRFFLAGILAVLIAGSVSGLMPWFLSFAAGAMVYVVVEELIPEAHLGQHSHTGTTSVLAGFFVMMMLDVMLG